MLDNGCEGSFRSLRSRRTENARSEDEPQTTLAFNPGTDVPLTTLVNLLDNWDTVTEPMLSKYILFLRKYGQIWDVQNLDWSLELMENSCESSLHNRLKES